MSDLFPPTISELMGCIERELRLRRRVYPRRVADRRMSQKLADREIALMEAVLKWMKDQKGA